jgi:hypothetical protein
MPTGSTPASWSPERKKKQALAIYRWKPWEHGPGPQTKTGKRASAMRTLKSGTRSADVKANTTLATAMGRMQRDLLTD